MKINANKIIIALSVIGILISLYLTYVKLTASPIVCIDGNEGCSKVQNSSYSSMFGIPVAAFGVLFYFVMFSLVYYLEKNPTSPYLKKLNLAKNIWMLWGVGFSIYLTYLELFVIHAICQWCLASAFVTLFIISVNIAKWRKDALYRL